MLRIFLLIFVLLLFGNLAFLDYNYLQIGRQTVGQTDSQKVGELESKISALEGRVNNFSTATRRPKE